jgi:hypothetical protein
MKFKKLILLGFTGQELDSEHWQKIDSLTDEKVSLASDDSSIDINLKNAD